MFRVLVVLAFGVAAVAFAGDALAQSAFCADLQRQYQFALGSSGGGASAEQVARRLTKQRAVAQQNGCYRSSGLRPSPQCPQLVAAVRDLEAQLARAQTGRSGQSASAATAIQRQLVRYGCGQPRQQPRAALAGNRDSAPGGSARTLCVRTCDGYYFPISTVARRDRFKVDAEACQSMFAQPGEAELFLQRPNADVATAVSLDGKLRYGEQPYAFLFRHMFSASCQAQLKGGLVALGTRYFDVLRSLPPKGKGKAVEVAAAAPPDGLPSPRLRPRAIGEDPETIALRAGGAEGVLHGRDEMIAAAPQMRRVGETWYADLYDPDKPPMPEPTYRPPLGFDLIGAAMAADAAALSMATQ